LQRHYPLIGGGLGDANDGRLENLMGRKNGVAQIPADCLACSPLVQPRAADING
jgi:hypothetical protein